MQVKPQSSAGIAGLLLHSALELMEQLMFVCCRVWARGNGRLEHSMQGSGHCDTNADSPQGEPWQGCICVLAHQGMSCTLGRS